MDTKIKPSFWTDKEVEELPAEMKLALVWMLTNSQINICGILQVTERRFAFETGLAPEVLWRTVEALPRALKGFRSMNIIYCRNFIRHQLGSGKGLTKNKIFRSVVACASAIKHVELIDSLIGDYPEIAVEINPHAIPMPSPCHGVREGEGEGVEKESVGIGVKGKGVTPSGPVSESPPDTDAVLDFAKNGTAPMRTDIAMAWMDARARDGWKTKRDGHTYEISDWRADLRSFARAYVENESRRKHHETTGTHRAGSSGSLNLKGRYASKPVPAGG